MVLHDPGVFISDVRPAFDGIVVLLQFPLAAMIMPEIILIKNSSKMSNDQSVLLKSMPDLPVQWIHPPGSENIINRRTGKTIRNKGSDLLSLIQIMVMVGLKSVLDLYLTDVNSGLK